MSQPQKILAIIFKYLGDVVITVPALRAIREKYPESEIHVLVPEEAAPLLRNIPWLTRVWAYPRVRGKAALKKSWPVIRALRREKFDRSIDFVGNDRGALISLLCGAGERLAPVASEGFFGRRFCYNQRVKEAPHDQHEVYRILHILTRWEIPYPRSLELELHVNPAWDEFADKLVPPNTLIAHVTTSQPKKEWPLRHWAEFHAAALKAGHNVIFAAGPSARDQAILSDLKKLVPTAGMLPVIADLTAYLAALKRATIFVSGDTGPLHFAVALGVPTVSLFGPSNFVQWKPLGERHHALRGPACLCPGVLHECANNNYCLAGIRPEQVMEAVAKIASKSRR